MKKYMTLFLFALFSFLSFAASYRIEALQIENFLKENGSMEVHEAVYYDIDDINGVLFYIDAQGFGDLQKLEIYQDKTKRNGEKSFERVPKENYEISYRDGVYEIKVYSKNYRNRRSFYFVYELTKGVQVYEDVAVFNRKVVGQNWQTEIPWVEAKIHMPKGASFQEEEVAAFGHGPLYGNISWDQKTLVYQLENYYPGDFVETHVLMPTRFFGKVPKNEIVPEKRRERLMAMEAELAEEANRERERYAQEEARREKLREKAPWIYGILLALWSTLMFYIHKIFPKKKIKSEIEYLRDLPDESSPALVGLVMTETVDENEVLASLLNLIRKKVLQLDEIAEGAKLTLMGELEGLTSEERQLLEIYFENLERGNFVVLQQFERKAQSYHLASKFELWKSWIYKSFYQKRFGYEGLGGGVKVLALLLAGLGFLTLPLQMSLFESPLFMVVPFFALALIASAMGVKRANRPLQEARNSWGALKKFLEDYSLLEEANISSIQLWEQYFVYAVALGVSEKVVKAYEKALKMGKIQEPMQTSFGRMNVLDLYSRRALFQNFAQGATRTYRRSMQEQIRKSQRSSPFGRGGGFSSGSSGGGGSRGGGGAF